MPSGAAGLPRPSPMLSSGLRSPDFGFAGAHHAPSYPWAVGACRPLRLGRRSSSFYSHPLTFSPCLILHVPRRTFSNFPDSTLPLKSALRYVTPSVSQPCSSAQPYNYLPNSCLYHWCVSSVLAGSVSGFAQHEICCCYHSYWISMV